MKFALLVPALLFVAACDSTPVVSDFNGASVKIQTDTFAAPEQSAITDAEATRICKAGGKRRAEYASTREVPNSYQTEHLYLCLN